MGYNNSSPFHSMYVCFYLLKNLIRLLTYKSKNLGIDKELLLTSIKSKINKLRFKKKFKKNLILVFT